jgi:subtilisin family serine protease
MSFDDQGSNLDDSGYASQFPARTHPPSRKHLSATSAYGVKVAILDTGVDRTHPGFYGVKMSVGRDWSILPPGSSAYETRNGLDDDGDHVNDEAYGHGTHVAGIVKLTAPGATLITDPRAERRWLGHHHGLDRRDCRRDHEGGRGHQHEPRPHR